MELEGNEDDGVGRGHNGLLLLVGTIGHVRDALFLHLLSSIFATLLVYCRDFVSLFITIHHYSPTS